MAQIEWLILRSQHDPRLLSACLSARLERYFTAAGLDSWHRAIWKILVAILVIGLVGYFGSTRDFQSALERMLVTAVAFAMMFLVFYLFNIFRSPAIMHDEAQNRIRQLEQTQATLTLSGPHLHSDPRFRNKKHWRMNVYNVGPAAARNVQMKLRCGAPESKDSNWTRDYPYPVYPVGTIKNDPGHISSIGQQINATDDQKYEITFSWKAESGQFFTDINTKGGGHNNIQINSDERWTLSYEVTAENASPIRFVLEILIDDDEVTVAMLT
jgi:hypothetical protein